MDMICGNFKNFDYNGYTLVYNFFRTGEWSISWYGARLQFETVEDAKTFIDNEWRKSHDTEAEG